MRSAITDEKQIVPEKVLTEWLKAADNTAIDVVDGRTF